MQLTIKIDTENDAFQENINELKRIIISSTEKIDDYEEFNAHLRDINGNKVGYIELC